MRKSFIGVIIGAVIILIFWYSFQGGNDPQDYIDRIVNERVEKDTYFREASDSPVKGQEFTGLEYYSPDPGYRVKARLIPIEEKRIVDMPTNDGKTKEYREFALAEFELNGQINQLMVYELPAGPYKGKLFIPFADATSDFETYAGGRYLDPEDPAGDSIILDFNLAYNPYCAYDEGYSCPLPPPANLLDIPIKAGEKTYKE